MSVVGAGKSNSPIPLMRSAQRIPIIIQRRARNNTITAKIVVSKGTSLNGFKMGEGSDENDKQADC
jgi:hypothetical protein